MKVPEEAICSVCKQIFCCGKCREKHEIKKHAIRIRRKSVEESTSKENLTDSLYVFCPICSNRPFPLYEVIYAEMLEHIKRNHLPLHCRKCTKVYIKIDDLREFSKCVPPISASLETDSNKQAQLQSSCVLEKPTKATIQQNSISTQTSPFLAGVSSITPISVVNMQWKAKAKVAQDMSENSSSLKNFSFVNNSASLRHSIGSVIQIEAKGKLVRTTSTPLQSETECPKRKDQTFNASGGQVSSIHSCCNDSENHNSPVVVNAAVVGSGVTAPPQPDAVNLYRKFNGRTKIAAVTPLRHVMSKSIQKAFAEHGLPSNSEKKAIEQHDAFSGSPLDLRLSPALRRSKSDSFGASRIKKCEKVAQEPKLQRVAASPQKQTDFKYLISNNQLKTESIVITRTKQLSCYQSSSNPNNSEISHLSSTGNSVYKTCQSFEIITSTEIDEVNVAQNTFNISTGNDVLGSLKCNHPNGNNSSHLSSITPITRLPGSTINKKLIKFETPRIENKSKTNSSTNEEFYTPTSSPELSDENVSDDLNKLSVVRNLSARFSPSSRPSIHDCAQSTAYSHYEVEADDADLNDEVFTEEAEAHSRPVEKTQTGAGSFLKSIVGSVLRLPSSKEKFGLITQRPTIHTKPTLKTSLIKRCTSLAGSLVRSTSLMDEKQLQTLKRKRTHTISSQLSSPKPTCLLGSVSSLDVVASEHELNSTKRFRINGRKPIERMRHTSS